MQKTIFGTHADGDPMAVLLFAVWVKSLPTASNLSERDFSELLERYRLMIRVSPEERRGSASFKAKSTCESQEIRELFTKTAEGTATEEEEQSFMEHALECSKCWMALLSVVIACT